MTTDRDALREAARRYLDAMEFLRTRAWRDSILAIEAEARASLDVDALATAMALSDGVKWPSLWIRADFDWVARQVAARYRAILDGTER